ncbi:mucosal pentraxin-like [Pseudonaja textilis]|uniref:mucosal pentraxin-like n=1 Tax=Pseudonaja textilis TaxID=8673 RepID=UPI000EAA9690|nr:mucosal pentraxin-like [Pseudonaja textilis]
MALYDHTDLPSGSPSSRLQEQGATLGDIMEKKPPWFFTALLVTFCISGILTEKILQGKVFVFPKASTNSYVLLKPNLQQGLRHFTLSLEFFTDLTRSFVLFSAASQDHDNEILLIRHPEEYHTCVGGECAVFTMPKLTARSTVSWESICMTWDSATGILQLWLNGQRLPRKGVAKGYEVKVDLVVMLGQEQDSYGGTFDADQCFVGEIAEVYLWDNVLPAEQIRNIQQHTTPAPLVAWTSLKFEIQGYVLMEPL